MLSVCGAKVLEAASQTSGSGPASTCMPCRKCLSLVFGCQRFASKFSPRRLVRRLARRFLRPMLEWQCFEESFFQQQASSDLSDGPSFQGFQHRHQNVCQAECSRVGANAPLAVLEFMLSCSQRTDQKIKLGVYLAPAHAELQLCCF